jgi:hypothetical protein
MPVDINNYTGFIKHDQSVLLYIKMLFFISHFFHIIGRRLPVTQLMRYLTGRFF